MKSSLAGLLRWAACLALVLTGALVHAEGTGPSPEAIEKARLANLKCFACHTVEALNHPPKADLDLKKLRGVIVDPNTFKNSDHGRLACTKCHTEGYTEHPHAANAKESTGTCSDCHSKKTAIIEPQFAKSVHAKHLADTFTCTTCHNPHLMRVASKLADAGKIVAQDNRVCLGCHDSDETFAKYAPEKKTRPPIDEIHAWLPNTRLHWSAVRCVECHTQASRDMLSHEIVNKEKAERKCVACHSADSALNVRLYRYTATTDRKEYGFINSAILGKSYVIGATRHPLLDKLMVGLAALTLLGVLGHAALRVLMHYLRRRHKHD